MIHREDSDTVKYRFPINCWIILFIELGKKELQNSNRKTDSFIKLLTKDQDKQALIILGIEQTDEDDYNFYDICLKYY